MSIYRKLNEEFDNSGCDSISCYANITANVLNEGLGDIKDSVINFFKNINLPSKEAVFGTLIASAIGIGVVSLLANSKEKKMKKLYLEYMSPSEYDELIKNIDELYTDDREFILYMEEYYKTKDSTKRHEYHVRMEKKIEERVGKSLYKKYVDASNASNSVFGKTLM